MRQHVLVKFIDLLYTFRQKQAGNGLTVEVDNDEFNRVNSKLDGRLFFILCKNVSSHRNL